MDVIDRAIEKGYHIAKNEALNSQTWQDFEAACKGKKAFYFGVANSAEFFFREYGDDLILEGVIDNDAAKQGRRLDELVQEALPSPNGKIQISDIKCLRAYKPDEAVILIGSLKHYEEISEQLNAEGIKACFVLLIMEAEKRRRTEEEGETEQDRPEIRKAFADRCCRNVPVEKKKVFFCSNGTYSDHGKYITEALLKIRRDLDIVWVLWDMEAEVPEGVRKISMGNWKQYVYEIETAGMWLFNVEVPAYITKREGQHYLQTKHWTSVAIKRFYLDAATFESVPERFVNWRRDGQMIDHIITGSDFDTESCRRGFGFEGEVLQYGSSRSDALFREEENRKKVYEYYGLDQAKHTLLYAPTYRFDKEKGKNFHAPKELELDFARVKKALEKKFGGEWYILMRFHPSVSRAFEGVERPDFVIDTGLYQDSQELISAADITVSDFSNVMFEASFAMKPVFLFATDIEDYIENEYELLMDYWSLPFPIAESNEEFEEAILNFDRERYVQNVKAFLDKYGVHEDGHASERVAEYISNYIAK